MKFRLPKTILCLLAIGLAGNLSAATWSGATSGSWGTTTNWSDNATPNGTVTYSGTVPNATQTLDGTWTIDGILFGASTAVTINTGTAGSVLNLGSGGITVNGTQNLTLTATVDLNANQTWSVVSGCTLSVASLTDTGTVNLTMSGAGVYNFTNTSSGFNGGGTVTFDTGSTWQHSTANSTGTALWFGASGTANSGSALVFNGNNTIRSSSGTARFVNNSVTLKGDLTLGASSKYTGGVNILGTLNLDGGVRQINVLAKNNNSSISGVISNGGLTKAGTGTLVLSGANTYTGVTTIKGNNGTSGQVNVSSIGNGGVAGNLGQATAVATNLVFGESGQTTGKLVYTGAGENTDRLFTINGNAIIENNGSGALNFTGTGDLGKTSGILQTFAVGGSGDGSLAANIIKGVGAGSDVSVEKTGAGTWTLSGNNSYTAGTTVTAGTLKAGSASAFGTGTVTVNGGTLNLNGQAIGTTITVGSAGKLIGASQQSLANVTFASGAGLSGSFGAFDSGTSAAKIYNTTGGASFTNLSGQGTFSGGLVTVTGNLNPGNSPGIQTFSAGLTTSAGSTTSAGLTTSAGSTTTFEIAGLGAAGAVNGFDQIALTGGILTLNGTLAVTSYGGFSFATLVAGNSFQLVSLTGGATFDTANSSYNFDFTNATLANGLAWDTSSFATNGTISVTEQAIPEPSSLGLLGVGMAGMLLRRRRKQA